MCFPDVWLRLTRDWFVDAWNVLGLFCSMNTDVDGLRLGSSTQAPIGRARIATKHECSSRTKWSPGGDCSRSWRVARKQAVLVA